MDLSINWYYLISLFILAVTPWMLKRSGINILFDSKAYNISPSVIAFTSIVAVTIFIVKNELIQRDNMTSYQCEISLLFLTLTVFCYITLFLICHSSFPEDIVLRNKAQLSYLKREKKILIAAGQILDSLKQKEIINLLVYDVLYKSLLLFSCCLYFGFYYQLAIILVNASRF